MMFLSLIWYRLWCIYKILHTQTWIVLEYSGDLISVNEVEISEKEYAKQNAGCFMYYFAGKVRKSLW